MAKFRPFDVDEDGRIILPANGRLVAHIGEPVGSDLALRFSGYFASCEEHFADMYIVKIEARPRHFGVCAMHQEEWVAKGSAFPVLVARNDRGDCLSIVIGFCYAFDQYENPRNPNAFVRTWYAALAEETPEPLVEWYGWAGYMQEELAFIKRNRLDDSTILIDIRTGNVMQVDDDSMVGHITEALALSPLDPVPADFIADKLGTGRTWAIIPTGPAQSLYRNGEFVAESKYYFRLLHIINRYRAMALAGIHG